MGTCASRGHALGGSLGDLRRALRELSVALVRINLPQEFYKRLACFLAAAQPSFPGEVYVSQP
jgi:hypothetical protein